MQIVVPHREFRATVMGQAIVDTSFLICASVALVAAYDWTGTATGVVAFGTVLVFGVLAAADKIDSWWLGHKAKYDAANATSLSARIEINNTRIDELTAALVTMKRDLADNETALRKARADYGTALERARITSDALSEAHDRIIALETDLRRSREERDVVVTELQGRIATLERKSDDSSPALKVPT